MLEIIALYIASRYIISMAKEKAQPITKWVLFLIGSWIVGEIVGGVLGIYFMGIEEFTKPEQLVKVLPFAMLGGAAGFLFVRSQLMSIEPDEPEVPPEKDLSYFR